MEIMNKLMVAFVFALFASPSSIFACAGDKCVSCKMRDASSQALEMMPGFLTSHAGLLLGMALGAFVVAVSLSRQAHLAGRI